MTTIYYKFLTESRRSVLNNAGWDCAPWSRAYADLGLMFATGSIEKRVLSAASMGLYEIAALAEPMWDSPEKVYVSMQNLDQPWSASGIFQVITTFPRSMDVGDVVVLGGKIAEDPARTWVCASVGFHEIDSLKFAQAKQQ